ncbi:hypothetical protein [Microbacterium sp.]|uniref:hypothetical protein n=1 Tax=Microbacterium sp. TaxID=51671 RepID=UPI003A8BC1C4
MASVPRSAESLVRSADPAEFDNPDVLSHLAKVVWQDRAGNLAYGESSPKIADAQTAWARQMPPTIYEIVPGKIYQAAGFQLCSTMIVVGADGLVVVDPGENDEAAARTKEVGEFDPLDIELAGE